MYENRAGLGYQNFEEVRTGHIFYIDKTYFIREWWEYADKVTLITRPRRFGKTLNMSMVECFFSNQYAGRSDLFEGLSIWEETSAVQRSASGEKNLLVQAYKYKELQGTFPVIFLSFANIKATKFADMEYKITKVISDLYNKNDYLLAGDSLGENEREYYKSIKPGVGAEVAADAIRSMAGFMENYYGKKVLIILDEYDTPMQEAWLYGYWDEAVRFFSSFFNSTFKTNDALERGLITGITDLTGAKFVKQTFNGSAYAETFFTGMNNLEVVSTTSDKYATCFGFTEEEVFAALDDAGLAEQKQNVKAWYDGFTFGSHTDIYNPWSIVSYVAKKKYDTYWANTSGNDLVNSLIQAGVPSIKQTMEELLQGKSFEAELDERIVFDQLNGSANAVWSLLLATGYLRVEKFEQVGRLLRKVYTLKLTNMEVESIFENMVRGWFGGSVEAAYNDFIKALLLNDVDAMNEFMNEIALQSFSHFDIAQSTSSKDAPERFYHGFVLGLMVELSGRFVITSNRESGFGRYDIMLVPNDREKDSAYIIEFKVHKPLREKDLAETVANALRQIEEKQYAVQLCAEGFAPHQIRRYGFAFRGKECLIG
ncbi:MAG: ATP-binding protein [Lachnospiraceae bacterium]|nr:ATP-binding protein [Lachnospiraceae bacterium]